MSKGDSRSTEQIQVRGLTKDILEIMVDYEPSHRELCGAQTMISRLSKLQLQTRHQQTIELDVLQQSSEVIVHGETPDFPNVQEEAERKLIAY